MDIVHIVQVAIFSWEKIKIENKTDADTMYGNTLIPCIHKACVSHYQLLIQ